METLVGIVGRDFVLTAADTRAVRSIVVFKTDEDKTRALTDKVLMLFAGEAGDTVNFAEYIQKNVKLYSIRNGIDLTPAAVANFVRNELAEALRSAPQAVNVLIAGYDDNDGPELYWIDYLGALAKIPYGVHGYGAYFTLSTLDRHYERDMSLDEAKDVLRKCIHELQTRFVVSQSTFNVKVVSQQGIQKVQV